MMFFVVVNFFIGTAGRIDNMAHLGGFVSGLIVGLPLALSLGSSSLSGFYKIATFAVGALLLAGAGFSLVQAKGTSKAQQAKEIAMQRALREQDYSTAIPLLEEAAAADPNDARTQALLGYAYESTGQRDKAIAAYQKALDLDSSLSRVRESLHRLQEENPEAEAPPK